MGEIIPSASAVEAPQASGLRKTIENKGLRYGVPILAFGAGYILTDVLGIRRLVARWVTKQAQKAIAAGQQLSDADIDSLGDVGDGLVAVAYLGIAIAAYSIFSSAIGVALAWLCIGMAVRNALLAGEGTFGL